MPQLTKVQIALAIAWFALFEALLTTSSSAVNSLGMASAIVRGLVRGLGAGPYFYEYVSTVGILLVISLALFMIFLVAQAWSSILLFTLKVIDSLKYPDNSNQEEHSDPFQLILGLFRPRSAEGVGQGWRLIRTLTYTWILVLLFQFLTGMISAFASF